MAQCNGCTTSNPVWANEKMESIKDQSKCDQKCDSEANCKKSTSLGTLIAWNISKALESNPALDVKDAITSAQYRLEQVSGAEDVSLMSESPHERYLTCALLAWEQLGHSNAESLCRFFVKKKQEQRTLNLLEKTAPKDILSISQTSSTDQRNSNIMNAVDYSIYHTYSISKMGPVVKLPVEAKVVMRMGCSSCCHKVEITPKAPQKDVLKKFDQACRFESKCTARLAELDASTKQLRRRAGLLAKREAARVELLERADTAWRDLELGYHRRLTLAEEKEHDLAQQIAKAIDERNKFKNAYTAIVNDLNEKSEMVEIDRALLSEVENEVCERAYTRLQLSEECAKGNDAVADLSCRATQLDRDLQLKEEQARRKAQHIESEADSARTLTLDAERAMRAELSALRDQIADVSNQLLDQDAQNEKIKVYLDDLRQEKMGMVEDLEGCKVMCDGRMQAKVDELKNGRDKLAALKEKVIECRCKVPMEASVEAKRTPSLAALCKCTPEQKILESCSCTSIRTKLLSDMLADLFGGLQSELGMSVAQMPCQLLKCLEDKHNWDRTTIVKNNLRDYFSKLLVEELDIAIATSIENYHAKWVGQSCADVAKITPDPGEVENEGWQERAIEQRAQKLATKLAEQLFVERSDQLTERAKEIVAKGPPPCKCKPSTDSETGQKKTEMYPCLVKNRLASNMARKSTPVYWHQATQDVTKLRLQMDHVKKPKSGYSQERHEEGERRTLKKSSNKMRDDGKVNDVAVTNQTEAFPSLLKQKTAANLEAGLPKPIYWYQAIQGVTQLRLQIEELKKDSLKKEDLKVMEKKFAKLIQRAPGFNAPISAGIEYFNNRSYLNDIIKKEQKINKAVKQSGQHIIDFNKPLAKRHIFDMSTQIKKGKKQLPNFNRKLEKPKNRKHTYAVNLCLCNTKQQHKVPNEKNKVDMRKQKVSIETVSQMSGGYKHSNPIYTSQLSEDFTARTNSKEFDQTSCLSDCVCFHKKPSNTSIDKLLETLAKWKCDLDTSIVNSEHIHYNSVNKQSLEDENISCKSKASIKPKETSRERPIVQIQHSLSTQNGKNLMDSDKSIQNKSLKKLENKNSKLGQIRTTESVYMGAVNLDKSNEDFCTRVNIDRKNTTHFKCSTSSKCDCDIVNETKRLDYDMIHGKTVKYPELITTQMKQQRPVNDVTVLNVSKSTEKNKSHHSHNATNNILDVGKTKSKVCDYCDYQIKFLGVTLADANPSSRNRILLKNNDNQNGMTNMNTNHTITCKECQLKREDTSKKHDQFEVYVANKSSSDHENITKHSQFPNGMTNETYEGFLDNYTKCCAIDKKGIKDELGHNFFDSNNGFDVLGDTNAKKLSKRSGSLKSRRSENTKYSINENKLNLEKHTDQSRMNYEDVSETKQKQKLSCECSVKFDEFKNFIKSNFMIQKENEDVAVDIQSLIDFKSKDENCVCCNNVNTDDSIELEENTFHILEEYLRKKLNEFKDSSCSSSCISPEEEEKLFTIILQRVKHLISESTNQITCKCCSGEGKSLGSWNRAYGMLQEYLKMKIKKVQCACVLAEDNNDSILPDVLDKVSKLIEYDFQRLKNVCGCKNDPKSKENKAVYAEVVNFVTEVPERDTNSDLLIHNDVNSMCTRRNNDATQKTAKKGQITYVQQILSSQGPLNFRADINSYDDINSNNGQASDNCMENINVFDKHENCNCAQKNADINSVSTIYNKPVFINDNNCKTKESISLFTKVLKIENIDGGCFKSNNQLPEKAMGIIQSDRRLNSNLLNNIRFVNSEIIKKKGNKPLPEHYFQEVPYIINSKPADSVTFSNYEVKENHIKKENISNIKNDDHENKLCVLQQNHNNGVTGKSNELGSPRDPSDCVTQYNTENTKVPQESVSDYYLQQQQQPTNSSQLSIVSIKDKTAQNSVNTSLQKLKSSPEYPDTPYIGYTINCACEDSMRTDTCPKLISKSKTDIINKIMKKCMPDQSYFQKVSYIMNTQPLEDTSYFKVDKSELPEDDYFSILKKNNTNIKSLLECETTMSQTDTQFVLKTSKENVDKNHATTNTFNDNVSIKTSCSAIIEDTNNWCECSSQYNSNKNLDNEQLKNSIYFPSHSGNFDNPLLDELILTENPTNLFNKLTKHVCSCEMIPICQVKMLIENIESKLLTASCTCDSMVSKACPVHR